jgi:hypothetical protein
MPLKSRRFDRLLIAITSAAILSGCATWSSSNITNAQQPPQEIKQTPQEKILLTEGDFADRPYKVLSDLSVTVNKTTIFHADPTKEMVNTKLKEEAAKLGADAVTHVRYGTVGVSMMSWGSLDGKGRAVQFTR